MIRKLKTGNYRIYGNKVNRATGKRPVFGTYETLEIAQGKEMEIRYNKSK